MIRSGGPAGSDGGAAVAEFVLVSTMLLFVVLGVVQVGLVLHVRNVVTADAAEGARHAAALGTAPGDGGPYAERLIRTTVPGAARGVRCVGAAADGAAAVPLVRVICRGRMRLTLVPLGLSLPVTATARSIREQAGP